MNYIEIIKKCLIGILICLLIYIVGKLTIFYIPFLVAYIISIIIDPVIKWINKKTSCSRKVSSVIVLVSVFLIIITLIIWGGINLVSETTNLIGGLNTYLEKTVILIKDLSLKVKIEDLKFSKEVVNIFQNTASEYLKMITKYLKDILNKIIDYIGKLPNLIINIIITILATYFITSDKFYILDRMEHHLSRKMMGKIIKHAKAITISLCGYLKAEILLSIITFFVVLIGLNIFCIMGMSIEYPILMAILIGFIDLLPILGAGCVMVPWAIILILNRNTSIALSILGLYFFIVVLKQLIEPKLVSKNISIHPIFTLLSMYTGFKILGVIGLLIGPIILIILKNIFSEVLDKGIVNTIVDN